MIIKPSKILVSLLSFMLIFAACTMAYFAWFALISEHKLVTVFCFVGSIVPIYILLLLKNSFFQPLVACENGLRHPALKTFNYQGFIPWQDISDIGYGKFSANYIVIKLRRDKASERNVKEKLVSGFSNSHLQLNVSIFGESSSDIAKKLNNAKFGRI
ncbi:hypothetical protein [Pseudoalteromonas luteoviolacea]|uniref:Uncharacterized protein n=1 Tax=Pseudoalteromonas luteoviolacea H33 TaxID=1365251 RepID=A0A162AG16_9GAMM|nr:hypothetical protein [Pseudoalteromonas luteoviolacea]KZN49105.1 hypothetical protein N476_20560 [Pseudoalteromonas luteoviolacea H33]KZN75512.1 hypothetical protein N477_18870 [Pseudoalteromonas luteoviolacea H33-S]